MTQNITIPKIIDCIRQKSGTINSTGLYNGKAGLSLSLFVAATSLCDEQLEDWAFDLLKESLIIKNNDSDFENGLAGIGYVLLYLTENNYLEIDFDEVFGKQYEEIIKSFEHIDKNPLRLITSFQAIYFLSKVNNIKKEDSRIQMIIKKIFEGLELFLITQFHDFTDIHYISNKNAVLNIHKTYLKLVDYSGYTHFSRTLLEDYAALYRKGKTVSSLETGYYLKRIADRYHITGYEDIIDENIRNGTNGMYSCTLSLRERIDLAKLINHKKCDIPHKGETIQDLLKTVNDNYYPFGYGAGLGRLIIYLVNKDTELL